MSARYLVLDFETYYSKDYTLSKMSVPEYVADPRFRVLGLAVSAPYGKDGANTEIFSEHVADTLGDLQSRYGKEFDDVITVCHNSYFDLFILKYRYGINPRNCLDTMLLCYHVHSRLNTENGRRDGEAASLEALAIRYGLGEKGSGESFCGARELNPDQLAAMSSYARQDAKLTSGLVPVLLRNVTNPVVELPLLAHTVKLFTTRSLCIDLPALSTLRASITEDTDKFMAAAGVTLDTVGKNKAFVPLLETALARTGRLLPMKAGKKGPIPATAKNDEAMIALCQDGDSVVAALANARLKRKSQDQLIARLNKIEAIAGAMNKLTGENRVPVQLLYYGARTGRWSGAGGLNFQNMGKAGFGGQIRNLIVPAPGNVFVVGDLAAIEARVLAWAAGQKDLLEAFEAGADIYSQFANTAFKREVRKPREGDSPELTKELKAFRQVGKEAILGLGYGMGSLKFLNRLRAIRDTAPLFETGVLSPLICREFVGSYRSTYVEIASLWETVERNFVSAINGYKNQWSGLGFSRQADTDKTVLVTLPSGRALRYPRAKLGFGGQNIKYVNKLGEIDEFCAEGQNITYGNDINTYGGKLVENIVQAIARDILGEAILRLEAGGYPVVLHCHDEVVLECKVDHAAVNSAVLMHELTYVPAWAEGLPLAAEVAVCDRYSK